MRHQIYLEIWSVINFLQLRIDAMCQSQWNVQFKTAGVFWHRFRFKKTSGFLNECLGGATTSSKEIKWYLRDIYIFIYIDTYSYTYTLYIHICFPSITFRRKTTPPWRVKTKTPMPQAVAESLPYLTDHMDAGRLGWGEFGLKRAAMDDDVFPYEMRRVKREIRWGWLSTNQEFSPLDYLESHLI